MKSNKTLKSTIGILFFLIVILGTMHYFLFTNIKTKTQASSELENILLEENDTRSYINSTKKYINSLLDEKEKVANYIISKDGEVDFLDDLEDLAKSNNLQVEVESLSVEISEDLKSLGLSKLVVKIKTKGSWPATYKFLYQLETMPLEVTIDRINLLRIGTTPTGSSEWEGVFEIKILKYI